MRVIELSNGVRVPQRVIRLMLQHFSFRRIAEELGVSDLELLIEADAVYESGPDGTDIVFAHADD